MPELAAPLQGLAPKPDWKSKTILGLVVALVAKVAEHLWPEVDIDATATVDAIAELIQVGGLLFAWYGRRVAQAPIRIRKTASAAVQVAHERPLQGTAPVPTRPAEEIDALIPGAETSEGSEFLSAFRSPLRLPPEPE